MVTGLSRRSGLSRAGAGYPRQTGKPCLEVIRPLVMLQVRAPLSLRTLEDRPHKRDIEVSHEAARFWWMRIGRPHVLQKNGVVRSLVRNDL